MDQFIQALKESAWERALSCCSEKVRAEAKKYESAEMFFKAVVPIETVVTQSRKFWFTRVKGASGDFSCRFDWSFRTAEPNMEHTTSWSAYILKTDAGWVVDFRTMPLKEWIVRYAEQYKKSEEKAKEREAMRKAFEPRLKRIQARTFLIPVSRKFVIGQPMLFRLELINEGKEEFLYDHQQVAVNGSLTITDGNGKSVPYIAGPVQTSGAYKPIKPGESVVLFDKLDIARQYDIIRAGRYKVQFNGRGLKTAIDIEGEKSSFNMLGLRRNFPSNAVEIKVIAGS